MTPRARILACCKMLLCVRALIVLGRSLELDHCFRVSSNSSPLPLTVTTGCGPQNHLKTLPCLWPHSSQALNRKKLWVAAISRVFPTSHEGEGPGMCRSFRRAAGKKPSAMTCGARCHQQV